MQKDCRRCTDDLGQTRSGALCDRAEIVHARLLQIGSMAQEAVGLGRRTATEADRLGPVGQIVGPVLPVSRELFGPAIRGILVQQISEGAKCAVMLGSSIDKL